MRSSHRLFVADARRLSAVPDASVHLVVTAPPYPMVEAWDATFQDMDPAVGRALEDGDCEAAFEGMHRCLDAVWAECFRALAPGGFACITIGDATRSHDRCFRLFPNHARVITGACRVGFLPLPDLVWRKPALAPTRFVGSGMLPGGAYVTTEHEHVLVLRKGGKRAFRTPAERALRRRSAYFWEERNRWFSDQWTDLIGERPELPLSQARARSAAFPLELAWRLVHMYSLQEDTVLDPFAGAGTTLLAAAAAGRSSVGYEHRPELVDEVDASVMAAPRIGAARVEERLDAHRLFVEERRAEGRPPKHLSEVYGFPVMTTQETELELIRPVLAARVGRGAWELSYQGTGRRAAARSA